MSKKIDLTGIDDFLKPKEQEIDLTGVEQFLTQPESPSMLESGLRGTAQGVTLGFGDELAGAAQGSYGALTGEGDLSALYEQYRDIQRAKNKLAEETNPGSYLTGNVVGGVAGALVPGGLIAKGGMSAIKGATALSALEGGLASVGTSEKEGLSSLEDAPVGMALGGILGGAGAATPGLIKKASGKAVRGLDTTLQSSKYGKTISDMFKASAETGQDLITPAGYKRTSNEVVDKASEMLDAIVSGPSGIKESAKKKALAMKAAIDSGVETDLTKVKSLWDEASKSVDFDTLSPEDKSIYTKMDSWLSSVLNKPGASIKSAETLRQQLASKASKEAGESIGQVRPGIERMLGGTSEAINVASPEIATQNKQIKGLLGTLERLGIKTTEDEIPNLNKLSMLAGKTEKEGITGSLARKQYEEAIELANQTDPALLQKIAPDLMEKVRLQDIAKSASKEGIEGGILGSVRSIPVKLAGLTGLAVNKASKTPAVQMIKKIGELDLPGKFSPAIYPVAKVASAPDTESSDITKDNEPVNTTKRLYSQSNEELANTSQVLRQDPSLASLADSLDKAIQNNDPRKRDSILFTLAQNPKARKLLHIGQ